MTPREALDRLAALPGIYVDAWDAFALDREEVAEILAEVTPETGGVLDRDQARDVLADYYRGIVTNDYVLDRLAGCVRPAAIDRDALEQVLSDAAFWEDGQNVGATADRVLALVRPVAGVTLTPEEAADAPGALRLGAEGYAFEARARLLALAARLEATQ